MAIKSKIAMVSYLNSKPFEFGLRNINQNDFEIITATPAKCASLFTDGSVDIALIPVGALTDLKSYETLANIDLNVSSNVKES